VRQLVEIAYDTCIWILDNFSMSTIKVEVLSTSIDLFLMFFKEDGKVYVRDEVLAFIEEMNLKAFWKLVFLTLETNNDGLNEKIHQIFKILIKAITPSFKKSINGMLLDISKKEQGSLYLQINPRVTNENRMGHLQTIFEYLSLTDDQLFLDPSTSKEILALPLTPTLWSLSLKIIPRENEILFEILKNFKHEYYSALGKEIMTFCEPLTGIRALECPHINWLDLIKDIKVKGKPILTIFVDSLKECNFGGRAGLTMAMIEDVKKLEISYEFSKLVLESKFD